MRKSLMAIAGLSVIMTAPLALADRAEHRAKHREHVQDQLNLSEEQVEEMRALRESGASREELRAVLTQEQQAKMDELHGERRQRGAERMQEYLELSDEQAEQLREIRQNGGGRDEMQAVLSDEQLEKMDELHARRGKGRGEGKGRYYRGAAPAAES
ncbi:MAG: hypothetical protein AAGI11_01295 [Pseudomonadota bacterium]